jgi:hypothetical protein
MNGIKLQLEIFAKERPAAPHPCKNTGPSIQDKVNHAIGCIDAGYNTQNAVSFLQRVYEHLSHLENPSEDAQILMENIRPVLSNFGYVQSVEEVK